MCMECRGRGWIEVDDGNGDGNTHAEPCPTCLFFDFISEQEADSFRHEDEDDWNGEIAVDDQDTLDYWDNPENHDDECDCPHCYEEEAENEDFANDPIPLI